ncbi:MAG: hypothetical protein M1826_003989 [Phylliscum demangeonii]|nr:MAG: hypothetical protein M1826_003989 [Phylliscum demangeonii]
MRLRGWRPSLAMGCAAWAAAGAAAAAMVTVTATAVTVMTTVTATAKVETELSPAQATPLLPAGPLPSDVSDASDASDASLIQTDNAKSMVPEFKYFLEAGEGSILGHYDKRFFTEVLSDQDREHTLHHMIRAYLNTCRERGLETWIAHGTLLGWWWNQKILPWDWDIDVQVTESTLTHLAASLNGTTFHYRSDDQTVQRQYLLDVNPFGRERSRDGGLNVIDARWIDVRSGLFVDIAALSETHPDLAPGVLSCKNYHRYPTADIFPLRPTTFEGVPAYVPFAYDGILTHEYDAKALLLTEFAGYRWDPPTKGWLKASAQQLIHQNPDGHPHVPRSVQPRSTAAGLRNIRRVFR